MKIYLLLFMSLSHSTITSQNTEVTTLYFIRHAEKANDSKNPELSEKGTLRTLVWVNYFDKIPIDIFYTTLTLRTQQTCAPIASSKQKEPLFYEPNTFSIAEMIKKHPGKTILIVGHSNTISKHINDFLEEDAYPLLDEYEFGNLYTITIQNNTIKHQLTNHSN